VGPMRRRLAAAPFTLTLLAALIKLIQLCMIV
jgi:hypothetical protein